MHPPQWSDPNTLANITGVSASTIRWWAANEHWDYVVHNGHRCYRVKQVYDRIDGRTSLARRKHLLRKLAA